ncbi:sugar ABC transporter permease [Paenibacillus psychroresistens]|uniref:Sugar ABC transporter permease n=1 Tax=Paenibacillus psychroresistens TaxID=1778678 RepID=A0A6B8RSL6_9BACL|nr:ABC transporter permease subunit [Paenibacillus psychroresistens]QGQ98732.1 sugar ABC transporter permease [Paenibacillus psychroresistens]
MNSKRFGREFPLHLMVLPSFILVLIFSYGPILGLIIAFKKYSLVKGIFGSKWNGFENYTYLFQMPDIWIVIRNTVYIAILKILAGLIVPITVALLLNEIRMERFKRWIQTMIYLPHFLSWIILGGILIDILSPSSGIVNQLLGVFGIDPIFFLGSNHWFANVMVTSDVWKEFGFSTIVYLAALTGINPSLYEAAVIDGANRWKQTMNVTLPGMAPIIVLLGTLSLANVLNAGFDQIYNLYSPQVYESGDIIDTWVYRLGIQQAQYSLATAVGLLKSFVSVILISSSYYLAYKWANYRIF